MDIVGILKSHAAWVATTAVVVGGLVRLIKSDTVASLPVIGPLIAKIPVRGRKWIAVGLSEAVAAVMAITQGVGVSSALVGGLIAALAAMGGHDVLIEWLRNGREFFAGDAGKGTGAGGATPSPTPQSGPAAGESGGALTRRVPSAMERRPSALIVAFAIGVVWFAGCSPAKAPAAADGWQVVARGVQVAQALNHVCAVAGKQAKDLALLDACAAIYDRTIDTLDRLEILLEQGNDPGCLASAAFSDLEEFANVLRGHGYSLPPGTTAALEVASIYSAMSSGYTCQAAVPATDGGSNG